MNSQSKGFSLIEVMVSTGILSVVVLGMTTIAQTMSQSSASAEGSQDLTALMYEVGGILNNEALCTAALIGKDSSLVEQPVVLSSGIKPGLYGHVGITSIILKTIVPLSPTSRLADVEIKGERRGQVFGSKLFTKISRVYYTVDASNNIVKCMSAVNDASANCAALGGMWDGTTCNFCSVLGGTIAMDGTCQVSGSTVFGWATSAPSACVAGTQTVVVQCKDFSNGTVVADTNCAGVKPATSLACSAYDWQISAWSACAGTVQTRTVTCKDTAYNTLAPNGDADCLAAKPATTQACGCTLAAGTSWTASGNTCNASMTVSIAEGSSAPVADISAPSTGTATFTCNSGALSAPTGASCTVPVTTGTCVVPAETVPVTPGFEYLGNCNFAATTIPNNGIQSQVPFGGGGGCGGGYYGFSLEGEMIVTCTNGVLSYGSKTCTGSQGGSTCGQE